jgi:hypothetical protein
LPSDLFSFPGPAEHWVVPHGALLGV